MWMLPTALRARIALVTLLGIFLVPVSTSSLRGLTHVLTCSEAIPAALSIDTTGRTDGAVLGSADTVTRTDADRPGSDELCGGLEVDFSLASAAGDRAEVVVTVGNRSGVDWHGSVELRLGGASVPLAIGRVPAGATRSDTVGVRIDPGRSYEISGTLLIGP